MGDFAQRSVAIALFGLSMYGLLILGEGGYGAIQRRRKRLAAERQDQSPPAAPDTPHVDDVRSAYVYNNIENQFARCACENLAFSTYDHELCHFEKQGYVLLDLQYAKAMPH